jgi:hypothetical protein
MNRTHFVMQAFLRELSRFFPKICKVTYSQSITPVWNEEGFVLNVKWDSGEHDVHFSKRRVLGSTVASARPRPIKPACNFKDDVMREILRVKKSRSDD